jgi:hypothetical protein
MEGRGTGVLAKNGIILEFFCSLMKSMKHFVNEANLQAHLQNIIT